jgi:hypothetical protein
MNALMTTTDVHTMLGRGITLQVTDIATGRRIVRQWYQQARHAWPSIELDVIDWYNLDPSEEVGLSEDDDGNEVITINGHPVAKYEHVR